MGKIANKRPVQACAACGSMFVIHRRWQRFCSSRCRYEKHYRGRKELLAIAKRIMAERKIG
jgi:hypothetical protein